MNRSKTPEEATERRDQTAIEQTFRIQNWLSEKSVRNIQVSLEVLLTDLSYFTDYLNGHLAFDMAL